MTLNEYYRVLKTGARLIISVPLQEKVKETVCIHCGRRTPLWGHLQSFSAEEIELMLKRIGFSSIRSAKIVSLPNYFVYLSKGCLWIGRKLPFKLWKIFDCLGMKLFQKIQLKLPHMYPVLLVKAIK
jgi:hypothetical protein